MKFMRKKMCQMESKMKADIFLWRIKDIKMGKN